MRNASLRSVALVTSLVALSACDKLKSAVGGGSAEGGAVGAAAPAVAGGALPFISGFEGAVSLVMKGKPAKHAAGGSQAMDLEVKGDKVRLDVPAGMSGSEMLGGPGYVVLNTPAKKVYVVMDAKKQVLVFDLDKTGEQLKGMAPSHPGVPSPAAPTSPPPKVTKTGKMDTVAGFACENWEIVQETKKSVACIAQQGASWFTLPITGIPTEHAWMAELMDGKHFPLRFIAYEKDGKTEEMRIEVTKIDKKALAASRFEIPAGYKTMDLAQMMQGFGAGLGAMPGMKVPARK